MAGNKVYSISTPRYFKIKREFFPYLTIAPYNNVKEKKGDSYGVSRDKGLVDGARTSSKTIKMRFVNTKIEKGRVHEKIYYCDSETRKTRLYIILYHICNYLTYTQCIQYFLTLVLFTFSTCCILRCIVCIVILCVFAVLCVYCFFYFRCRTAG